MFLVWQRLLRIGLRFVPCIHPSIHPSILALWVFEGLEKGGSTTIERVIPLPRILHPKTRNRPHPFHPAKPLFPEQSHVILPRIDGMWDQKHLAANSLSRRYLPGFMHAWWCRISSIDSIIFIQLVLWFTCNSQSSIFKHPLGEISPSPTYPERTTIQFIFLVIP